MDMSLPLQLQRMLAGRVAFDEIPDTFALHVATPDDAARIQSLVRGLSRDSRYHPFFIPLHELPSQLLERFTHCAPQSALTLLATLKQPEDEAAVGMAQYVANPYPARCEIGLLVADAWQGKGIGTCLLQVLQQLAGAAGIRCIEGDILAGNRRMRKLALRLGYSLTREPGSVVRASLRLGTDLPADTVVT